MSRSSRSTSSRAASSRVSWSSSSFEANQYVVAERGTPARSATARWVTAPVPRSPTSANVARRIVSRRAAPLGTFVLLTGTNVPLMTTATDAISYEDLYARWERGNWRASEIDFSEDARQWREELSDLERRAALRNYALFFWGEDAVADGLSTYIEAAPLDEQKYFLAPQKVDEARHAVFFGRFMHEVVGIGGTSTQERLAALEPQLTWASARCSSGSRRCPRSFAAGPRCRPDVGDHALPHRHRGDPRPAGAALHHELPGAARAPTRLPRGDGAGGPGRAAAHRLRREAAVGSRPAGPPLPARGRRHDPRGGAIHNCGAGPAGLGPPLHGGLRIHARGDRRRGRPVARDEDAQRRAPARGAAGAAGVFSTEVEPIVRARNGQRLVWAGVLGEKNGPPKRDPETMRVLFERCAAASIGARRPRAPG
jgi:hypothetical protein